MAQAAPAVTDRTPAGSRTRLRLLIAIPALNEEESITSIVERCLDARRAILAGSPVSQVDICVVSDGSTDRTVERAQAFGQAIDLVIFERNRGYGAAIKAAWERSEAELLGFIDADGTCDPNFFATLCDTIEREHADVVLGCRMTRESKMPLLRRVGNFIFAVLLTFFSSKKVRDTASGMRVVRRSSLGKLMPLPDGMHFTPAMSARAILSPDLSIVEREMPYHEREGRSKLKVVRDGIRFLRVIVEAAFLYRPDRPLAVAGTVSLAIAAGLLVYPSWYYLNHRQVQEWMIYRVVVADLLTSSGFLLLCAAYLSSRIVRMVLQFESPPGLTARSLGRLVSGRFFWFVLTALIVGAGALVGSAFIELVRTGSIFEHWSRFVAMSVCVSTAVTLTVTRVFDYSLTLLEQRFRYLRNSSAGVSR